ncbi:MAG: hypothetical protein ACXAC7_18535 [Candidatus Hodarchaeales archaeon]
MISIILGFLSLFTFWAAYTLSFGFDIGPFKAPSKSFNLSKISLYLLLIFGSCLSIITGIVIVLGFKLILHPEFFETIRNFIQVDKSE